MDRVHCCSSRDSVQRACACHQKPVGKWDVEPSWEVVGNQAGKRYSVMDPGQDSLVVCLHCCQSFCSRSIGSMKTCRASSNTDFGNRVSASSLSTHSTSLVSFLWYSASSAMTRFYLTCQGVEGLRRTPPIQLAKIVHRNTTLQTQSLPSCKHRKQV